MTKIYDFQGGKGQAFTVLNPDERSYGCWCFFGEDEVGIKGHGPPQNKMDDTCRKLANCYKCSRIDSLMRDTKICSPRRIDYLVDFNKAVNIGVLKTCTENNPGDLCAAHSCSCEVDFIKSWMEIFFSSDNFDSSFHHDSWEHEVGCSAVAAPPSVLDCCGVYPNRVPFDLGTVTECCGGRTLYNSEKIQCCEDGSLRHNC